MLRGVGKLLPVPQYKVGIFPYSCLSGILCSDGKSNTAWANDVGVGVFAFSISSHEQT